MRALDAVLGSVAAGVDRAVLRAMGGARRRRTTAQRAPGTALRHLASIARIYPEGADGFHADPRAIAPDAHPVRTLLGGGTLWALRWNGAIEPWCLEMTGAMGKCPANGVAWARLWSHPEPRPVVVLVHGYMSGAWRLEERIWGVPALYDAGLDVVQYLLPYHGVRRERGRRGPPRFPGGDPRRSNEGFRQASAELRELLEWLRRRGHPTVALAGMSLGGYTAALVATLDTQLDRMLLFVPLASLADYAREKGLLAAGQVGDAQWAALRRAHTVVDPLQRSPLIDGARVRVIAARGDRITPVGHAQQLASHFQAALQLYSGGHLLQPGRRRVLGDIRRFLSAGQAR